jgi:hypothetical protein
MPGKGHSPEQVIKSSVKSRLPSPVARASVRQYVGLTCPQYLYHLLC